VENFLEVIDREGEIKKKNTGGDELHPYANTTDITPKRKTD
jgi:hypothetical protein